MKAALSSTYEGLLRQLTEGNVIPALKLDAFPAVAGTATSAKARPSVGFVQVIKPPTLLEIHGPMFMSYPVAGHLQIRLAETLGEPKSRCGIAPLVSSKMPIGRVWWKVGETFSADPRRGQ